MGIGHYAFAVFVAALVCVVVFVCKLLFANVRGQRKLLDEQETKLLQLYTSVETLMEDFNDQVKLTTAEFEEREYRFTSGMSVFDLPPGLEEKGQAALAKMPKRSPLDTNRARAVGDVVERADVENTADFQKFIDAADSIVSESVASEMTKPSVQSRTEAILALAAEGKSNLEIAQELGVTRNEVLLVIGLQK